MWSFLVVICEDSRSVVAGSKLFVDVMIILKVVKGQGSGIWVAIYQDI